MTTTKQLGRADAGSRIASLDALRCLAMILVFFVHFHGIFKHSLAENSGAFLTSRYLSSIGPCGTDLFFLLSAALTYSAAMRARSSYKDFVVRRIRRIYPPFLLVLGLYLLVSQLVPEMSRMPDTFEKGTIYVLQNVFLLPGVFPAHPIITVTWSLTFLFTSYLVIPPLVELTGMRKWRTASRISFLAGCTVLWIALSSGGAVANMRAGGFLIGILAWEISQVDKVRTGMTKVAARVLIPVAMAGIIISGPLYSTNWPLRLAVVWCSGLILILVGANYSPSRTSLLSHPLVMWIAAVSYPFYLVHSLALHIWNHLWTVKDGGFGAFAFVICGTLGTAFLFAWILYDQLSRRWSLAPAVVTPQRRPAVVSARAVVA